MSDKSKAWFEREFPGGYPVELFPNLYGRLRGTVARIRELVGNRDRESLTTEVNNAWSIQRNVGHLIDLERLWDTRLTDYAATRAVLTPADLENRVTHEAGHDQRRITDLLEELTEVRKAFLARIVDLEPTQLNAKAQHPRLEQPMRLIDLLLFIAEHDDHHIARIIELEGLIGG